MPISLMETLFLYLSMMGLLLIWLSDAETWQQWLWGFGMIFIAIAGYGYYGD